MMRLKMPKFVEPDDDCGPVRPPEGWKSRDERLVQALEKIAVALEAIVVSQRSGGVQ
jgi:hypothetical protein